MRQATMTSRAFVLAFGANFLHGLALFAYLHLPGLLHRMGADELTIGILVGTMAAAAIAMRPALGWLMDRHGRHVVVRLGSLLHVVVCLSYLLVEHIGVGLYAIRIAHGIAEAMLFTALFTIAADVVPVSRRTEGIALFGISGLLPMSLGGLLGDLVLARADYAELFVVCLAAAALGAACGWGLPDSRPPLETDAPPPPSFLSTVAQPRLRPLWLVGFGFALAVASYFTFFKTFVEHTGIGSMGLFFTVYSLAAILLRLVLGWVPDRIGPRRALGPALLSMVIGLVVLAGAGSELAVAVSGLLCGLGHAFVFPILSSMVVTRAEARERGAALAMFTALFDLGLLVGSPLLGAVLERSSYPIMFTTAAGLVVACALGFGGWDRRVSPAG
ncbi:MAG: MFS transporter [Myxococcales bacterium]|nr:MFS transporter [Myxococcales bacterium]